MPELSGKGPKARSVGGESLPPMILPQHGLTRFLRVRLEVQDGALRWMRPRTLLGIVPLGTLRWAMPLGEVDLLRLRRATPRPVRLASGLLLLAVPLFVLPWWVAVPVMLFGAWVLLVSLGPALEVKTTSGKRHRVAVCFGHQIDADLFIEAVSDFTATRRQGRGSSGA